MPSVETWVVLRGCCGGKKENIALPWNHLLRLVGFSFEVVRKIWSNRIILTLILETCWAFLWGCQKNTKKLHYRNINSWHLVCPLRLLGKKERNCTTLMSAVHNCWVWGCQGKNGEIALPCRQLLRLVELSLRLSENNLKKLHYLDINWNLGCPLRLLEKLHYLEITETRGVSFEVVRKIWRNCTTLMSIVHNCWVVFWGCRGNRWSRTNLTLIFETCWAFFRGCQKNTKKLHDLSINSWHLLVCPLRLSRGGKKKLRYFDVSCRDFVNCPLRLSEKIWRKFTTLPSIETWVVLWGCWGKQMKKLQYLEITWWDLLGFPLALSEKIWRNWTTLTLVLDRC